MLIPIKHENMEARRWPVVTITLIVLNVVAFLFTMDTMEKQSPEFGEVKTHILVLAASHPELKLTPAAEALVNNFRKANESEWKMVQNPNHEVIDGWDAKMRLVDEPSALQGEMDSLCEQYATLSTASLTEKYAFVPAHPAPISYLTATFLHGGWLHLIGNMWFLWLAGFVLEDVWGRPLFTIFYLVAGAAALQIHAWMNVGSIVPCLGASGAVAGLMGAFMVRFPKMKIEMGWLMFLGFRFRLYKFQAAAIWLLPLWLLTEVFYGMLFGKASGTAHWAHVGGFVFGALVAVGLKYSGLEHQVEKSVEQKIDPNGNLEVDRANDLFQQGKLDEAMSSLSAVLAVRPDSLDALRMQRDIYYRRNQLEPYLDSTMKMCNAYVKQHSTDAALEMYEEYRQGGGGQFPAAAWLTLCRSLEESERYDRALAEYENLIAAYPKATQSIMAQLGSARVCLKRLNRPQDALKFYEAAERSSVPHLDMEHSIQAGIKEARAAAGTGAAMAHTTKSMA
jgi:membrane associated rhomboid family serine protease